QVSERLPKHVVRQNESNVAGRHAIMRGEAVVIAVNQLGPQAEAFAMNARKEFHVQTHLAKVTACLLRPFGCLATGDAKYLGQGTGGGLRERGFCGAFGGRQAARMIDVAARSTKVGVHEIGRRNVFLRMALHRPITLNLTPTTGRQSVHYLPPSEKGKSRGRPKSCANSVSQLQHSRSRGRLP